MITSVIISRQVWCNMVSTPTNLACLSTLEEYLEPKSYEEAATHPGWTEAMQK